MTVKQLIKILKTCPPDMNVCIQNESNYITPGKEYSPIFINQHNELCLFCDVDEAPFVKKYLLKTIDDN